MGAENYSNTNPPGLKWTDEPSPLTGIPVYRGTFGGREYVVAIDPASSHDVYYPGDLLHGVHRRPMADVVKLLERQQAAPSELASEAPSEVDDMAGLIRDLRDICERAERDGRLARLPAADTKWLLDELARLRAEP